MLRFDRKQQNSVKQSSFNKKIKTKKRIEKYIYIYVYLSESLCCTSEQHNPVNQVNFSKKYKSKAQKCYYAQGD